MPDVNFKHLRYFWAVAHEGHLTRAAKACNVSQSALSVQIQSLEAQLGQTLFDRRGRQMVLTEAGRLALGYADTIFSTGEELVDALDNRGQKRRRLRIGALATLSRNFQMQFLKPLMSRDDVDIVLRSGALSDLLESLETLELDVVLANLAPGPDTLTPFISHPIAEQTVSLIGLPDRLKPDASLADYLTTAPLILPGRSSSIRAGFDAMVSRMNLHPSIAAEIDDMAMIRLLAREGLGLAVAPPIVVQDELEQGLLAEMTALPELRETFFAITVKRRFANPLLDLVL
ncbi:LysR family transcriptional regulator [Asticcacaulis taihuensis]|jgi:LysR family transcriptional activator of nhaA|uniref:Transcriptional regulator, LysR family n=1 Tax=Asticcacaulis taihuensis TaxID=260084 RepID=A0A1G4SIP5_9CAUL|nr:LysR family transcriptional regulator [Asticcacaulis taihuensis]SCW69053.1 transcriptional regulator, LysR family [Asticcacaulis taihuensis]